jgi:hypothetical protein
MTGFQLRAEGTDGRWSGEAEAIADVVERSREGAGP